MEAPIGEKSHKIENYVREAYQIDNIAIVEVGAYPAHQISLIAMGSATADPT